MFNFPGDFRTQSGNKINIIGVDMEKGLLLLSHCDHEKESFFSIQMTPHTACDCHKVVKKTLEKRTEVGLGHIAPRFDFSNMTLKAPSTNVLGDNTLDDLRRQAEEGSFNRSGPTAKGFPGYDAPTRFDAQAVYRKIPTKATEPEVIYPEKDDLFIDFEFKTLYRVAEVVSRSVNGQELTTPWSPCRFEIEYLDLKELPVSRRHIPSPLEYFSRWTSTKISIDVEAWDQFKNDNGLKKLVNP